MLHGHFSEHWHDEDGNPSGGVSSGRGFTISWQNGPLGRGNERQEPNGAFVEDVIQAVFRRIEHYQNSKFHCPENVDALLFLRKAAGPYPHASWGPPQACNWTMELKEQPFLLPDPDPKVEVENIHKESGPQTTRVKFHLPDEANLDTLRAELVDGVFILHFDRKVEDRKEIVVDRHEDVPTEQHQYNAEVTKSMEKGDQQMRETLDAAIEKQTVKEQTKLGPLRTNFPYFNRWMGPHYA